VVYDQEATTTTELFTKISNSIEGSNITKNEEKVNHIAHLINQSTGKENIVMPDSVNFKIPREQLYNEIWELSGAGVAKKYDVPYSLLMKLCREANIPIPTSGYWTKINFGKTVAKTPLPDSNIKMVALSPPFKGNKLANGSNIKVDKVNIPIQKPSIQNVAADYPKVMDNVLEFLDDEERAPVLSTASQIQLPDGKAKMHPQIIAHRRIVNEWILGKKADKYSPYQYTREAPSFLATTVSEETLPRVFHIFDALIQAMEPLGCSLTDDLRFVVRGETVPLQVSESKDEILHVNTKEENLKLLKYEEDKRRFSYASKPNIRKYDHIYNGRISITVYNLKSFRDCKSYVVEDRLSDILIQMYEASNVIRKEQEAKEEAERKRKEEERLREERRKQYNDEVDHTLALTNLAEDYDIAFKIRHYISAVEVSGNLDENKLAWVEWAKAKADWYDPTIAKEDEFLGKRKHEKDAEEKALKHKHDGYSWLWND